MKHLFSKFVILTCCTLLCFGIYSCGVKDSDIEKNVNEKLASTPGITASVADGVVTLSGQTQADASKSMAESNVKTVKGVKSVVNNVTVTPPQVNTPVIISPDDTLTTGVNDAIKDFEGVNASVNDGVVTLTGTLKRARLQNLMQALNTLKPKKINNQLTLQ
jgi:hyperosmotically inducible periplasmic protein